MTENPYRLARDIRGIGFKTADAIAMKLGIAKRALIQIRVRAGIGYVLTEALDEGHCGLPDRRSSEPLAARLLDEPGRRDPHRAGAGAGRGHGRRGRGGGHAVRVPRGVVQGRAEPSPSGSCASRPAGSRGRVIDVDRALPWVARKTGLSLAPGQAEAVRLALTSKAVVITGGPGVGKTTIVDAILRILAAKGVELVLCAPTGRAARRMSEATGLEARTIHRLLEVDPRTGRFGRDADNPLDCGLLVVDDGLDGGRPADAGAARGGARRGGRAHRERRRISSLRWGRARCWPTSSRLAPSPVVRLTEVSSGRRRCSRIVTSAQGINRGRHSPIWLAAGRRQRLLLRAGRGPGDRRRRGSSTW